MGANLRSLVSYLALLAGLVLGPASAAALPTEEVIYDFKGPPADGQKSVTALIIDKTGALYGTTSAGGSGGCGIGCGTIFRLKPPAAGEAGWSETVLYHFPAANVPQGSTANPSALTYAGAILGEPYDGVSPLFGTATYGGAHGAGYVFELVPPADGETAWTEKTLYSFGSTEDDGAQPQAALLDKTGALYGTTTAQEGNPFCESRRGTVTASGTNCGLVFKLTPPAKGKTEWTEQVIYRFSGVLHGDGGIPAAQLLIDKIGRLYGTTSWGGTNDCGFYTIFESTVYGCGTSFRLTPPRTKTPPWSETWLYSFLFFAAPEGGPPDIPSALTYFGAISGRPYDGVSPLYGTTQHGRAQAGTVFDLVPPVVGKSGGEETVLLTFSGANGANPLAGLLMDRSGRLYGTTSEGGAEECGKVGCGIAFRLDPPAAGRTRWTETVLHNFGRAGDGRHPYSALIANGKGTLFGTTSNGGTEGFGTVYKLVP